MGGTRSGGKQTEETIKALYGEDYYSRIGTKGGQARVPKGFAITHLQVEAGRLGGSISRRGDKPLSASRIAALKRAARKVREEEWAEQRQRMSALAAKYRPARKRQQP